jgi:hypothetical protein
MSERSDELTKLPEMLAEAQVARWQGKYGRDPTGTGQQRSWLVNKMRTGIATMGIKLRLLSAQVIIRNLRNMQGNLKSLPPTGAQRRMGLPPGPA